MQEQKMRDHDYYVRNVNAFLWHIAYYMFVCFLPILEIMLFSTGYFFALLLA